MTPGELVNINDIQFTAYNTEISNSILAVINNGIQDIATFSIAYEIPVFDISFENNPEPNSSFPASLFINNYSNSKYDDVFIKKNVFKTHFVKIVCNHRVIAIN